LYTEAVQATINPCRHFVVLTSLAAAREMIGWQLLKDGNQFVTALNLLLLRHPHSPPLAVA
ncbi:MAG: hypothetical protein ABIH03_00400, partial [Pseudomonadota bacterium]